MTSEDLKRLKRLQTWWAGLTPEQIREAREAVRNCAGCLHFGDRVCRVHGRQPDGGFPDAYPSQSCSLWQDTTEPRMTWATPLSGRELERAYLEVTRG